MRSTTFHGGALCALLLALAGPTQAGQALFQQHCSSCHGGQFRAGKMALWRHDQADVQLTLGAQLAAHAAGHDAGDVASGILAQALPELRMP